MHVFAGTFPSSEENRARAMLLGELLRFDIYVYTYYHYYVYTCHLHIIGLLCPPVFSFRFVKNTDEDLVRAVADVADAKVVHLQVQLAIFQGFHG